MVILTKCMDTTVLGLLVDWPVSFRSIGWSMVLNTDPPQGHYIATYCNSYRNRVNQYMTYLGPLEFLEQTWSVCWNKWILPSGTWAYEMFQSIHACVHPPIYLSTCLPAFNCCTYLSTYLWSIYLAIDQPIYLFTDLIYQSIYLSIYLSVCLSVCLSIYLSI